MRDIRGRSAVVIGCLYVAFVAWSLYGAVFPVETHTFRMVHLAVIFALGFLVHPLAKKAGRWAWWLDLSLATMGRTAASAGHGALITTALLGGPQASGVATTMSVAPIMWPILEKAGHSPNSDEISREADPTFTTTSAPETRAWALTVAVPEPFRSRSSGRK